MKNRSASVCDSAWCTKRAQALLRGRPGASRDRPGKAFGSFPGALGPPQATQDRSRGGLLAPQSRPQHVPAPSPERSRAPQSARERNLVDFLSFLGLPRPLRTSISDSPARFSSEVVVEGGSFSESQKRAVQSNRASWHVRCMVASCCARGFRRLLVRSFYRCEHTSALSLE